jgi:hypothetical protein
MSSADDRPLVHQLDPLLRELMAFGLVERTDSADGTRWVLSAQAQRRLSELDRPVPAGGSMFYVGHRCDRCRDHTVTRLVGSEHLCARCQALADTTPPAGVPRQQPA